MMRLHTPSARAARTLLTTMLAATLVACGDDQGTNLVPIVISNVLTFHDSTFDFSALTTFAMPDLMRAGPVSP